MIVLSFPFVPFGFVATGLNLGPLLAEEAL